MARVKRGVTAHKRHKRLLDAAEGRRMTKRRLVRAANEANLHAMAYATRDRKQRKRDMRGLWIVRINAAARLNGLSYSAFVAGLIVAETEAREELEHETAPLGQIFTPFFFAVTGAAPVPLRLKSS